MPAISEIATVLTSGAALVCRRGSAAACIGEAHPPAGCTHATLPPVLLADLPEDLPLETLIVAGEACSADAGGALVAGTADGSTPTARPRRRSAPP